MPCQWNKTMKKKFKAPEMEFSPSLMRYEPVLPIKKSAQANKNVHFEWRWLAVALILIILILIALL